jgi:hypothetical protein
MNDRENDNDKKVKGKPAAQTKVIRLPEVE